MALDIECNDLHIWLYISYSSHFKSDQNCTGVVCDLEFNHSRTSCHWDTTCISLMDTTWSTVRPLLSLPLVRLSSRWAKRWSATGRRWDVNDAGAQPRAYGHDVIPFNSLGSCANCASDEGKQQIVSISGKCVKKRRRAVSFRVTAFYACTWHFPHQSAMSDSCKMVLYVFCFIVKLCLWTQCS